MFFFALVCEKFARYFVISNVCAYSVPFFTCLICGNNYLLFTTVFVSVPPEYILIHVPPITYNRYIPS